jgi:hypothetical protein
VDAIVVVAVEALYLAFIVFAGKKFDWFNRTPKETDIVSE